MSFIENYQSRKNLLANNLQNKQVDASGTEGFTSLINKVEDVSRSMTNGILLYADKNTAHLGDTINLSAIFLQNGIFTPNITATLYSNTIDKAYNSNEIINKNIGNDYEIIISSGNFWISKPNASINKGDFVLSISNINNGYIIGYANKGYLISPRPTNTDKYKIKNNILSYNNTNIDLSRYSSDITNLYRCEATGKITVIIGDDINFDSNGLGTYSYSCTDIGEKYFYIVYGDFISNQLNINIEE